MPDMEIMKELNEIIESCGDNAPTYFIKQRLHEQAPDAVKREIVRVIEHIQKCAKNDDGIAYTWAKTSFLAYLATFQTKPRYCEGMQEALKDGRAVDIGGGIRINLAYNCGKVGAIRISVCPFCKEGENCIKGVNDEA